MPPKPKKEAPNKKTEEKKKAKVVEDKTFGLKNKNKSTKVQKYVKAVHTQVEHGNKSARQVELDKAKDSKFNKKDARKKAQEELNALFKPVEQKVAKGVDPKSVLCAFFKAGTCKKGERCKFSHDINIGRKGEKRNLYEDAREEEDGMANWDEAQLEEVVNKKHGESNKSKPKTAIICKFFLDAVENSKYGWFWQCPNGETCHYKHALPPGFVLKRDQKKAESEAEQISIEDLIERERAALNSQNLTRVTLESFLLWKDRKRKEKVTKAKSEKDKRKADYKAGKAFGISGREMFEFNPDLVLGDDDEAEDSSVYLSRAMEEEDMEEEVEGEYDGPVREINLGMFASEVTDVDVNAPMLTPSQRRAMASSSDTAATQEPDLPGHATMNGNVHQDEANKLDMAGALPPETNLATEAAIAAAIAATVDGGDNVLADDIAIDCDLFDGDDMFEVDEELEGLELQD